MIYIIGAIGSGKSSLTKALSDALGSPAYYEKVEDMPMLNKYYAAGAESRTALSFPLQVAFLNYRYAQLRRAILERNAVMDSSLLSDNIMAKMIADRGEMDPVLYQTYLSLSMNMQAQVSGHPFHGFPDMIIYLDIDGDHQIEQIEHRGREMEKVDDDMRDYYASNNAAYKEWYNGYAQSPVMKIDMTKTDFVNNENDLKDTLAKIGEFGKLLSMFNPDELKKLGVE